MKTVLLKNLTEQQKDEMRQTFAGASFLRTQLIEILSAKIKDNNKQTRSKDAYNIANWAFLQSDAVGYERAMQEVISLLSAESEATNVAESLSAFPQPRRRGRPPGSKNTTKFI